MSVSHPPSFDEHSRLMLFAPHPDDESLACGVLLQRAVSAKAQIRVIYVTDGDNNPWPQRVIQRKWHLTEFDRARWGQLRREEAINALNVLGVANSNVEFFGLPDQGLTELLVRGCERTLNRLTQCIVDWAPTDIIWPDISDTHPDHSALGVLLDLVLERLPPPFRRRSVWTFVVHGCTAEFCDSAATVRQSPKQTAIKMTAISRHETQLKLSSSRFMAYAGRPERFAPQLSGIPDPGCLTDRPESPDQLTIRLPRLRRKFAPAGQQLLLLGHHPAGGLRCLRGILDSRARGCEMFDCTNGAKIGVIQSHGNLVTGLDIAIPADVLSLDHSVHLKLQRRGIFFDDMGWVRPRRPTSGARVIDDELDETLTLAAS